MVAIVSLIYSLLIHTLVSGTNEHETKNITKCMSCICQINNNCTPVPDCRAGSRCGMYQISWSDHYNEQKSKPLEMTDNNLHWVPCAQNEECSRKVIESKKNKCAPLDPCLGHARDVFLYQTNSDCESKSSSYYEGFLKCYYGSRFKGDNITDINPKSEPLLPKKYYVIALSSAAFVVSLFILSFFLWNRTRSTKVENETTEYSTNNNIYEPNNPERPQPQELRHIRQPMTPPDTIPLAPIDDARTRQPHLFFPYNLLNVEPLAHGHGHFGSICKAMYSNEYGELDQVAIKSLIRYDFTKALAEATIACSMNHPNVLKLLGILIDNDTLKLVFPFMENGDLGQYLRTQHATPTQLRSFCVDIASGMEYLSTKNVVHRDLAARNCMLDSDLNVKIADFGLSRKLNDGCHISTNTSVILSSSAPECFKQGAEINEKTDVWAFGVTCWEIFNRGKVSPIMVQNDGSLLGWAPIGKCPTRIYELLLKCWSEDQEARPTFTEIYEYLMSLHHTDFDLHIPGMVSVVRPTGCGGYIDPNREINSRMNYIAQVSNF